MERVSATRYYIRALFLTSRQFRRRSSAEESFGRFERALSGFTTLRKPNLTPSTRTEVEGYKGSEEDVKGPLGLNLLYTVNEPLIDFIFVHGLGGGSRKTWSKSSDPYHYWPKEWLSRDPEFSCVRVHSFGYKADWTERKDSVLNIHDFALSLLGEIQSNPDIRRSKVSSDHLYFSRIQPDVQTDEDSSDSA